MKNVKRKLTGMLLAATVLSSSIVPTYAATVKYTFKSGSLYGITTECKGFPSYVTAWAKVENNNKKIYRARRNYSSAKATASLNCVSGTVTRTGGYKQ